MKKEIFDRDIEDRDEKHFLMRDGSLLARDDVTVYRPCVPARLCTPNVHSNGAVARVF